MTQAKSCRINYNGSKVVVGDFGNKYNIFTRIGSIYSYTNQTLL